MTTPRTVKLDDALDRAVDKVAYERGVPRSEVLREALATYVASQLGAESFASRASDLAGCARGPRDLSSNAAHMTGYGGSMSGILPRRAARTSKKRGSSKR